MARFLPLSSAELNYQRIELFDPELSWSGGEDSVVCLKGNGANKAMVRIFQKLRSPVTSPSKPYIADVRVIFDGVLEISDS